MGHNISCQCKKDCHVNITLHINGLNENNSQMVTILSDKLAKETGIKHWSLVLFPDYIRASANLCHECYDKYGKNLQRVNCKKDIKIHGQPIQRFDLP
jgi:hypothetical protein